MDECSYFILQYIFDVELLLKLLQEKKLTFLQNKILAYFSD